jgi:hypothetical protein
MDIIKPLLTFTFFSAFLALHHWIAPNFIEENGSVIVVAYMIIDMICQPNMTLIFRIHHALAIALCLREMVAPCTLANQYIRSGFIETEWSTLVLQCFHVWRNKQLFILFAISFTYFRIFRICYLYNAYVREWDIFRDLPALALYLINCHWFFGICRKLRIKHDTIRSIFWVIKIACMFHWDQGMQGAFSILTMIHLCIWELDTLSVMYLVYILRRSILCHSPLLLLLIYDQIYSNHYEVDPSYYIGVCEDREDKVRQKSE